MYFFFSSCNTAQHYVCATNCLHHLPECLFLHRHLKSSLTPVQSCLVNQKVSLGRSLWPLSYFRSVSGCLPELGMLNRFEDL